MHTSSRARGSQSDLLFGPHEPLVGSVSQVGAKERCVVGSACILVARRGRRSTQRASGRGRSSGVLAEESSAVLACERNELVALGALRNLNPVGVAPGFDLGIGPGVEQCIGEGLVRGRGGVGDGCERVVVLLRGDARVASDLGDELVALAGLGDGDAALVEPELEVGFGPGLEEPVAGVGGCLAGFVGDLGVVFTRGFEEGVAGAGGGVGDLVVVEEGFEL